MEIGLDKMEVRAIFRRNFVGKTEEEPFRLDYMADAVSEVIKENNKKSWRNLQEAIKKTR